MSLSLTRIRVLLRGRVWGRKRKVLGMKRVKGSFLMNYTSSLDLHSGSTQNIIDILVTVIWRVFMFKGPFGPTCE